MKVKTKWKKYALGYHLSEWDGRGPATLYTLLSKTLTNEGAERILTNLNIEVWQRFAEDSILDVRDSILDMAESLQETENAK